MKKIQSLILLTLITLLPLISTAWLPIPIRAAPSEDLVGIFGGLESGEQLEYKVRVPDDLINWINNETVIHGFTDFLNWTGIMNETEATEFIMGINALLNNILNTRFLFTIESIIQPNTSAIYPYGNVRAELDITGFNYTQLYTFLVLLGAINTTEVPYADFLVNAAFYTEDVPVTLDVFSLSLFQPIWPERSADPVPNVTVPIVTSHYQPDDISPYPIDKFTNWVSVDLWAWGINPIDKVIIEHNGTGTLEQEELWNWWAPDYYRYINISAVGYKEWWAYRFFINDTSGNNITTEWHYKCKNGAVMNLPLIIPNNFDYWAGYFDGFMDLLQLFLGISDFPIIQDANFLLDLTYETDHNSVSQTHHAARAYIDLSTTFLTDYILTDLLGMPDFVKIAIFGSLENYTLWVECFHSAPIELDSWWNQDHGFLLLGSISLNLTHILDKWEFLIVRLLELMGAPPYIIGNVTMVLDFLKIGEIGFSFECTWYNSIEHVTFSIPWWVWLIIGVAVAISVGFYLGWQYRGQRGFWARRTVVFAR